MSKRRTLSALALLAAAAGSLAFVQEPKPAPGPLVTFAGESSSITKKRYAKATDKAQWARLWLEHEGIAQEGNYDWFYNQNQVPIVDFDQCMVIAVFQGTTWNSAGVIVKQVLKGKDVLTVRFDDKSFQTAGPDGGGQKVRPYGFFVLPRSDKPIVLEENVQDLIRKPPEWKERARL